MLGVCTMGCCSMPRQSPRCWSVMIKMMLGGFSFKMLGLDCCQAVSVLGNLTDCSNDILSGGGGQDTLNGGGGNDTFLFTSAADSTTSSPDTINDFVSGSDKIQLVGIMIINQVNS